MQSCKQQNYRTGQQVDKSADLAGLMEAVENRYSQKKNSSTRRRLTYDAADAGQKLATGSQKMQSDKLILKLDAHVNKYSAVPVGSCCRDSHCPWQADNNENSGFC